MLNRDVSLAPLSGFAPYRRRQTLAQIAQQLQWTDLRATTGASALAAVDVDASPCDWAALTVAVRRLTGSPDPAVVFKELAAALVPTFCEQVIADIWAGDDLARWQDQPVLGAEIPAARIDQHGRGWTVTVFTAGHPGAGGDPDYVAALTCTGRADPPTPTQVAVVKLASQHATAAVHRAQLEAALAAAEHQMSNLRTALTTNRAIGAATGILMQQHKITYQQAFFLLHAASQNENIKLAALADTVLYTGALPPPHQTRGAAATDQRGHG